MNATENVLIKCPYCGESIELVIDCSFEQQSYIEDCEVCCRPISLDLKIGQNDEISITPRHENDC